MNKKEKEIRICKKCQKSFNPSYKPQVYCSRTCSMFVRQKQKSINGREDINCSNCNICFSRVKSRINVKYNFCSNDCKNIYEQTLMYINSQENKFCEKCNKEFSKRKSVPKRFCSVLCAAQGRIYIKPKNLVSWTKGKTTKTDIRIYNLGRKISISLKQKFKDGTKSNIGSNNPNYGKTIETRTPQQRINYAIGAHKRLLMGCIHPYKNSLKGKYISTKTGKEMFYKSSYELKIMKAFDNDISVIDYSYEPFGIFYTEYNMYYPDFLVKYSNDIIKIIEVKGFILDINKFNLKENAIKQYCQEQNFIYELWKKNEVFLYSKEINNEQ